ncbi:MAG: hypothetical protein R8M45_10790, partial [Ghiorsea sp.]
LYEAQDRTKPRVIGMATSGGSPPDWGNLGPSFKVIRETGMFTYSQVTGLGEEQLWSESTKRLYSLAGSSLLQSGGTVTLTVEDFSGSTEAVVTTSQQFTSADFPTAGVFPTKDVIGLFLTSSGDGGFLVRLGYDNTSPFTEYYSFMSFSNGVFAITAQSQIDKYSAQNIPPRAVKTEISSGSFAMTHPNAFDILGFFPNETFIYSFFTLHVIDGSVSLSAVTTTRVFSNGKVVTEYGASDLLSYGADSVGTVGSIVHAIQGAGYATSLTAGAPYGGSTHPNLSPGLVGVDPPFAGYLLFGSSYYPDGAGGAITRTKIVGNTNFGGAYSASKAYTAGDAVLVGATFYFWGLDDGSSARDAPPSAGWFQRDNWLFTAWTGLNSTDWVVAQGNIFGLMHSLGGAWTDDSAVYPRDTTIVAAIRHNTWTAGTVGTGLPTLAELMDNG